MARLFLEGVIEQVLVTEFQGKKDPSITWQQATIQVLNRYQELPTEIENITMMERKGSLVIPDAVESARRGGGKVRICCNVSVDSRDGRRPDLNYRILSVVPAFEEPTKKGTDTGKAGA